MEIYKNNLKEKMDPNQLRELIKNTLKMVGLYSDESTELLMLTAAQESHCGKYIKQIGGGPALGIFQMEPATLKDLQRNYLAFREDKKEALGRVTISGLQDDVNLHGNLLYQIVSARLQYMRFSEAIPKRDMFNEDFDFIEALAMYWKKYWNTEKGKGTVGEAFQNYARYVR